MIFENGYHQLYNDKNADMMFDYINKWISKDSKKSQITWNSAKVSGVKSDFMKQKNYVKKYIFFFVAVLMGLIGIIKRLKNCYRNCTRLWDYCQDLFINSFYSCPSIDMERNEVEIIFVFLFLLIDFLYYE